MDRVAEHDDMAEFLWTAARSGDHDKLFGSIAVSLHRIAEAQEELVALAKMDLEEAIAQAVEDKSQEVASEMVADQTKRSFIGKSQG